MSLLLATLAAGSLLLAADAEKPVTLRYLKEVDGRLVPESEITTTHTDDGTVYVSRTSRPGERMTLTLRFDRAGRLLAADTLLEAAGAGARTASLTFMPAALEGTAAIRRGATTDFVKLANDPILTTAPDWSDIFQLINRYDGKKGGRQEFPGLWFHPVLPPQRLTFAIEHTGNDKITVKDAEKMTERDITLDRYQIKLRSGDYLAWADANGRVYKLAPAKPGAAAVVLEGYNDATRDLK